MMPEDKGRNTQVIIKSSTFVVFAMIMFALLLTSCDHSELGIGYAEKDFQEHKELFILIRDYLIESEYNYIGISRFNEQGQAMMFLNQPGVDDVPIDNMDVNEALKSFIISKRGHRRISKVDNFIVFQKTRVGLYYGIIYSIGGKVPDGNVISYLTSIEQMAEDGWYYYEANYDEWRSLPVEQRMSGNTYVLSVAYVHVPSR